MFENRRKQPCVYILASAPNGVLYIGVTGATANRVNLHKQDLVEGFTKKYGVHMLVYYEMHDTMTNAIPPRKTVQEVGTGLEGSAYRINESRVARSFRRDDR